MNDTSGADRDTGHTVGTLFIIYPGQIVYHMDSVVGAGLFALPAAYTASTTDFSSADALVVAVTIHVNQIAPRNHLYDLVGTFFCAQAAAGALLGINGRHIVYHVNRIVLAN